MPKVPDTTLESVQYLDGLVARASDRSPFGLLCTFLRVGGATDPNWDPLEESRRAFDDLNWMLHEATERRGDRAARRVGLLMYCHAVEMSSVHEILANLLYVLTGEPYKSAPLHHLRQKRKTHHIPASSKRKLDEIKRIAQSAGELSLVNLVDSFFREDIRNAFSHSDYVFGDDFLRWTESGAPRDVPFDELDSLLNNCFAFYGGILSLQTGWLGALGRSRRFHRWPNYEVLELLRSGDPPTVHGFQLHFSNGSAAKFSRSNSGVEATNFSFGPSGEIEFMAGDLDDLVPIYKVKGIPVVDWDALERDGNA